MNTKRLARLREVLTNIPKERFDLCRWVCGTTACAVGWGCTDPELQKEGLRLTNPVAGVPKFGRHTSWDAVQAFFELNEFTTEYLFDSFCYDMTGKVGPLDVVKRIDEVLENGEHYTSQNIWAGVDKMRQGGAL